MSWDMNNYPASLKNFDKAIRKKAIQIANALIEDGYSENRAIPIAIEQAKEWYGNTNKNDITHFVKYGKLTPKSSESRYRSNPNLLNNPEMVMKHDNGWAVQAKGAKKAAKIYKNKQEAIQYGEKVSKNKGTSLYIYDSDGDLQEKRQFG